MPVGSPNGSPDDDSRRAGARAGEAAAAERDRAPATASANITTSGRRATEVAKAVALGVAARTDERRFKTYLRTVAVAVSCNFRAARKYAGFEVTRRSHKA
ncbi:hypothetical protein EVAR_17670_1 [Eumeta japonica]|uniref:Uncharacterized protein n=1 Tax=Eumeta variegata TaxID=151549 RepID=A0A4C1URM3_EUMVA|nr:hypothetical protein EVAR_17670_1 [Eumeta japonica]